MSIALICECPERDDEAQQLRQRYQLPATDNGQLCQLVLTAEHLELRKLDEPKLGAVKVDFVHGAADHRRRFGGGRGEAVAKAVGAKGSKTPSIIDATAGLGRDAFVLASVGCDVTLIERHPAVAALLDDGLMRARLVPDIAAIAQRMTLLHGAAVELLPTLAADVVYLDPMFPHRPKSALVKKEMRVFQQLVGADEDAAELFNAAQQAARHKIVVKRPDYAPPLTSLTASGAVTTKSHRFDIYAV